MKTVKSIVDKFVKDLKVNGAVNYIISVADPDSDEIHYRNGTDERWAYGACAQFQSWFRRIWENDAEEDNRKSRE